MRGHSGEGAHEAANEQGAEASDYEPRNERDAPRATFRRILQLLANQTDADQKEEVAENPGTDLLAEHAPPSLDAAKCED